MGQPMRTRLHLGSAQICSRTKAYSNCRLLRRVHYCSAEICLSASWQRTWSRQSLNARSRSGSTLCCRSHAASTP
jgi:hypothetical protein